MVLLYSFIPWSYATRHDLNPMQLVNSGWLDRTKSCQPRFHKIVTIVHVRQSSGKHFIHTWTNKAFTITPKQNMYQTVIKWNIYSLMGTCAIHKTGWFDQVCLNISHGYVYKWIGLIKYWKKILQSIFAKECLDCVATNNIHSKGCLKRAGPWFNIKMSSHQFRKSHCGDKTVVRSSYLHNRISYTGKTSTVYWCMASNWKALQNEWKNPFMCGFICL